MATQVHLQHRPRRFSFLLIWVCLNLLGSGMHQQGHSYWKNEVLNHWILGKLFIVRQPKYHIVRYTPYYPILSPVYPIHRFIPSISPYINRFPWPLRFGHPEAFGDRVHLGLCSTIVGRRNVHGMGEVC